MIKGNKAHTATANRIARRYGATYNEGDGFDIQCDHFAVEVETSATIGEAIERLEQHPGASYVAVTNKEAVQEALRLTRESRVGVMDPQGNVVKQAADAES